MWCTKSILTQDQLEEYYTLTFLNKSEILYILKRFLKLNPEAIKNDLHIRFPKEDVIEVFPEFKYNPFCDRIFRVFSSRKDDKFSFEDILDLGNVMSINCPLDVKAGWAFKIFDINEDDEITEEDISEIIDKLSQPNRFCKEEKEIMCEEILNEISLSNTGEINYMEFIHSIMKLPDFAKAFSFRM